MTNNEAIGILEIVVETAKGRCFVTDESISDAYAMAISALQAQEAKTQLSAEGTTSDLISRQDAIEVIEEMQMPIMRSMFPEEQFVFNGMSEALSSIKDLPSAQPEPLTDKEQRIFLAAMGREEKVCEEVDRNYVREPYEDSLVRVCKEIRRKVKGALWT